MMKSMNNISMMLVAILGVFTFTSCKAAINNPKTETFKVWGNCEMCEERIEEAAFKKYTSKGDWNKDTKLITITFDSTKTNSSEILKNIAYVGHDNQQFLAPDDVYANLPGCCQYARHKNESTQTTKEQTTINTTDSTSAIVNPMGDVYPAYFDLKDALTKDNSTNAASKGKTLLIALNAVKMDAMETYHHSVFMKYHSELTSDAEKISKSSDLDKQRGYFATLSANMYEIMKVIKPETTVYYDYCPMYNDGAGAYWLSTESSIKNPYFGSSMLTCGKIKETIK